MSLQYLRSKTVQQQSRQIWVWCVVPILLTLQLQLLKEERTQEVKSEWVILFWLCFGGHCRTRQTPRGCGLYGVVDMVQTACCRYVTTVGWGWRHTASDLKTPVLRWHMQWSSHFGKPHWNWMDFGNWHFAFVKVASFYFFVCQENPSWCCVCLSPYPHVFSGYVCLDLTSMVVFLLVFVCLFVC